MGMTKADILQERTSRGWPEGQQPDGSDVKGKRRRLFLTIRQGDSNHGYKSIFEACPSPAEYKEHSLLEPRAGRDKQSSAGEGDNQVWRKSKPGAFTTSPSSGIVLPVNR